MENELVAAEIYLHPVNTADATRDIDEQLKYVEAKIQDYTVHLSGADYAVAIASGLLSGAIDSTIVGETDLFQQLHRQFHRRGLHLHSGYSLIWTFKPPCDNQYTK